MINDQLNLRIEQRLALTQARKFAREGDIIAAKVWFYKADKILAVDHHQQTAFVRSFPRDMPLADYYQEPSYPQTWKENN